MFGFGKKSAKSTSSNKMEEICRKAETLNLLQELNDSLLEEKEVRNLVSLEKEKHEVFRFIKEVQDKRDKNITDLRSIWEDATKNKYTPKDLWESHQSFEQERLKLAQEYDEYYGYSEVETEE